MKQFYVYILKCNDGSYYTGHTDDLEKRLSEHYAGRVEGYTAATLPVQLLFYQDFSTRADALVAERQIKKWSRRKKEALIKNDWIQLVKLAQKDNKIGGFCRSNPSMNSGRTDK